MVDLFQEFHNDLISATDEAKSTAEEKCFLATFNCLLQQWVHNVHDLQVLLDVLCEQLTLIGGTGTVKDNR